MGTPKQGDPLGHRDDVIRVSPPTVEEIREAIEHASLSAKHNAEQAEAAARRNNGIWPPQYAVFDDRIHDFINRLLTELDEARATRKRRRR